MAATSGDKKAFWRTDWFVGALIVLLVLLVHRATNLFESLALRFYDLGITSTSRQPTDRIAVIAIDDQSIANIGRWPWPRDVQAQLIDQLAAAKAKVIVNTTFFFEPQADRGLAYMRKIKELMTVAPDSANPPSIRDEQINKLVVSAEFALDTDAKLAASMKAAGNVLVPSYFTLGEAQGKADGALPNFALKSMVDDPSGFSEPAQKSQQPIEIIGSVAAGIGHLNQSSDADGTVRSDYLLVNYFGKAMPSLALAAAMKSLNLAPSDIRLNVGESVQLGKLRIKTGDVATMRPQFYPGRDGKPAFATDSFFDVVSGKIPASKYADKIVIIGATATGLGVQFPTPSFKASSPAELIANVTSSILSEHFIVTPAWAHWVAVLAVLFVAVYLIAGLPRLSAGMAAGVTAILFLALIGTEFGLLAGASLWLDLVFPAALLLIGHLGLTTKRFLMTEAGKVKADEESAETNRMMGLAEQGQGRLDMAFDRFRRVPVNDALMGNLYSLALDFERKRQFNKAQAVYEHMAAYNQNYKDLQTKLNRAKNLSETVMLGGGGSHPGGTMLLAGGAVEKPMLGRYQIDKELGKGAMGVVYLGKDPKIGRVVAIKTMALSQEFDGDELVDARERFFREAETAGRLQHQNIVTIFDAGEEHDLAYIAMEFLKGKDLVDACKDGQLLPVTKVLSIVARVAEALAYAHRQNVVHRDIKPANIMYERETDVVKVTDFGIARITDSSKTKTGLVLGTPSFMSPEQLAGKKVDGRSDLYSLGVMLFQMLTGVLPFRGESMAELMFKIANEAAPDVRLVRKDLPESLALLVAKSLAKMPEARFQDGEMLATELRAVISANPGFAGVTGPVPLQGASSPMAAQKTSSMMVQDAPSAKGGSVPRQNAVAAVKSQEFDRTGIQQASATGHVKPVSPPTDIEI